MRGPPTHEHRSTLRNDYSSSGDTRHGSPTSSSGPSPNHRRPQRGNGRRGASHGRRDCRRNICSSCRDRNKRCDGLQPVCGLCARHPTENPCTYPESDCGNSRRQDREDNVFRATSHFPQDENLNAVVNDHNTTNYGEGSHTYNGSHVYNNRRFDRRSHSNAVVHVHVHGSGVSTSPSSRSPNSTCSSMPAAPTSQDGGSTSASSETAARLGRQLTRSELYTSLLLECGFGYPLWKPAPRCTPEGEYVVSIGDVGILTDGLPFNVLFNITQPIDSLANKDGVPEGVHPPCILQPRWITVVNRYHREGTMIAQPKGAISHHHLQQSSDSSAYTLRLTNSHGALLKLPKGGVLRNLERTTEFHERIQKHWRQWYEFAETQGDLGGNQTLYVVTGVEQCSTWAAAAWDDAPGERPELLSLRLEVGKPIGNCSWAYSTARCETQTADPSGDCDAGDLKNTVFVRGFWVNKFGGSVDSAFLPSTRFGGLDDGLGDDDGGGDGLHGRSSSGPSPLSGSPSGFGSAPASGGGCGDSGAVAQTDSVNLAPDLQVQNLSIDCLGPSESTICRPCEVINRFAFEVISRTNSAVLNTECIVVSHDNDWISTLEESDNGFPGHSEFLQRICSKFKFVIEKGMIHTEELTTDDAELVQRSLMAVHSEGLIPVVVELSSAESMFDEAAEQSLASTCSLPLTSTQVHHDERACARHRNESPPLQAGPPQQPSFVYTQHCTACRKREIDCNREVVSGTNMCMPCKKRQESNCDLLLVNVVETPGFWIVFDSRGVASERNLETWVGYWNRGSSKEVLDELRELRL